MAVVDLMRTSGMPLLDVQWCTDHLASLGVVAIARQEYLARLADAVGCSVYSVAHPRRRPRPSAKPVIDVAVEPAGGNTGSLVD
jgi:hypothetical protein